MITEQKMKPTGVADLNARVKMKHTEQKMKPIRVGHPNIEVKMIDNVVRMKPPEQILVERFYFYPITKSLMFNRNNFY